MTAGTASKKRKVKIGKIDKKQWGMDLLYIVLGSLIQALAYSLFIAPANIIPGGVYGISIALSHLSKEWFSFAPDGLPIGVIALFFNVPLLLLATKKIGLSSGPKTILTFLLIAFFTDLIMAFTGGEGLAQDDRILSAFYGGAIVAVGVLLIFKAGSTSAGTDVLGRILTIGTNRKLGSTIMVVDSCVVLFGLLVFQDWTVPLYSLLTIFVYGKVVEIFTPENPKKAIFIVSRQSNEIATEITQKMNFRGTYLHGRGMYQGEPRDIIFSIVERKELPKLRRRIREIDENVFISTMDASKDQKPPVPKV